MGKRSKKSNDIANSEFERKTMSAIQKYAGDAPVQMGGLLPDEGKISHALQTLLKMETSADMPLGDIQEMLKYVMFGWNISNSPAEKQEEMLLKLLDLLVVGQDEKVREQVSRTFRKIIITKNILFPDDKRIVMNCEVVVRKSGLAVTASAIRPAGEDLAAE